MKLTAILLLGLALHVSASSSSQTISLKAANEPLEKIFSAIKRQTGYVVIYNNQLLANARPVTIHAKNISLAAFLDQAFKDQPLEYVVRNRTIFLKVKSYPPVDSAWGLQAFPVTGIVKGSNGQLLGGINVAVKGSSNGTTTDEGGRFFMNVGPGSILVFSGIGFQTKELPVTGEINLVITLLSVSINLDTTTVNYVSTGYQKLPKERMTGSFSTVTNRQLELRPTANILDRLEGFAGGLVFHRNSVDKQPKLVIRGRSTIYSNDQPLYVVDGFPIEGDISNINPNDVENVTILKDAAASSIWGVRAANGVVVITTKKGSFNQKPAIKLRSQLLVGKKPDLFYLPFMNTSDYIDLEQRSFEQGRYDTYFNSPPYERSPLSPVIQTLFDMQNGVVSAQEGRSYIDKLRTIDIRNEYSHEFYRPLVQQQHVLSIQGGSEWARYFFSAGYDKELSSEKGNGSNRITMRTDHTIKLLPKLDLNIGVNIAWTQRQDNAMGLYGFQGESSTSLGTALETQYAFYPYQQLRDEQGNAIAAPRDHPKEYNDYLQKMGMRDWTYRPADEPRFTDNTTSGQDTRLTVGLEYRLLKNLNADIKYQYEGSYSNNKNLHDVGSYYSRNMINKFTAFAPDSSLIHYVPVGGVLIRNDGKRGSHTFRGQLNFFEDWQQSKHVVAVIAGMELRSVSSESSLSSYYGYNDQTLLFVDMDKSAAFPQFGQMFSLPFEFGGGIMDQFKYLQNRYASFYSNASYTFDRRYVFSASGRIDKSSLFGVSPKDRNVPLWSAGAAWNIQEEAFFRSQSISTLKFRATYGFNGNVSPLQSAYPMAFTSIDPLTQLPVAGISTPANPLLQWEKVRQINLGLDFGLFNNKLSGSLEWFVKNGKDLLGDHFLDPSSGFPTIRANVASMRGNGFDLELNYRSGKIVTWDSRLLFSHAKDKVTAIAMTNTANIFGGTQNFIQADRELFPILNRPVYSVYSYRWAGLDGQGNPRLYDEKGEIGNYATILNSLPPDQLVYNGPAQPTFFGGWNNSIHWKGFNLSATVTYKLGHKFRRSSINYAGLYSTGIFRSTGHSDYALRWQKPGDELHTQVPSDPGYTNYDYTRDEAYRYSDILVADASHVRLKDITFSYDLPSSLVKRGILRGVQLYLYLDNVGLLWRANKYGIDPDFVPLGYSNYLPMPLTCTGGIKIEL